MNVSLASSTRVSEFPGAWRFIGIFARDVRILEKASGKPGGGRASSPFPPRGCANAPNPRKFIAIHDRPLTEPGSAGLRRAGSRWAQRGPRRADLRRPARARSARLPVRVLQERRFVADTSATGRRRRGRWTANEAPAEEQAGCVTAVAAGAQRAACVIGTMAHRHIGIDRAAFTRGQSVKFDHFVRTLGNDSGRFRSIEDFHNDQAVQLAIEHGIVRARPQRANLKAQHLVQPTTLKPASDRSR